MTCYQFSVEIIKNMFMDLLKTFHKKSVEHHKPQYLINLIITLFIQIPSELKQNVMLPVEHI